MTVPIESGPLLRGECNKCGACCVVEHEGEQYVCDYLVRIDRIGHPQATLCLVYSTRKHHMRITMTNAQGRSFAWQCAADGTDEETRAIIARGVGKGCSMEVVA